MFTLNFNASGAENRRVHYIRLTRLGRSSGRYSLKWDSQMPTNKLVNSGMFRPEVLETMDFPYVTLLLPLTDSGFLLPVYRQVLSCFFA